MIEPIVLPDSQEAECFKNIPQLYLYGDYMNEEIVHTWVSSINEQKDIWTSSLDGVNADYKWLELPDIGIKGNSHMLMMDDNSYEIADIINSWLKEKGIASE